MPGSGEGAASAIPARTMTARANEILFTAVVLPLRAAYSAIFAYRSLDFGSDALSFFHRLVCSHDSSCTNNRGPGALRP